MTGKKLSTVGISDNDWNQKIIDRSTNSFLRDTHFCLVFICMALARASHARILFNKFRFFCSLHAVSLFFFVSIFRAVHSLFSATKKADYSKLKQILSPVDEFYHILPSFDHLSINQMPLLWLFAFNFEFIFTNPTAWICNHLLSPLNLIFLGILIVAIADWFSAKILQMFITVWSSSSYFSYFTHFTHLRFVNLQNVSFS